MMMMIPHSVKSQIENFDIDMDVDPKSREGRTPAGETARARLPVLASL